MSTLHKGTWPANVPKDIQSCEQILQNFKDIQRVLNKTNTKEYKTN